MRRRQSRSAQDQGHQGPESPERPYETEMGRAEIAAFIDQSRWLLEYHRSRSEAMTTRAVALLGLIAAITALVGNFALQADLNGNRVAVVALVSTALALLGAAACCLGTLMTRTVQAPAIAQLRRNWSAWVRQHRLGLALFDIAESFARASDLGEHSVLDVALREAESRAKWFRAAVICVAVSVLAITVVVIDVIVRDNWWD